MYRLGVVGLNLGVYHARNILEHPADWQLAAVCDALPDRVESFTQEHSEVQGFTDYSTFLGTAPIDGIILATPHDLHASMTIKALEAGKDVLVEKPMALNTEECRAMNAAARTAGKTLMVAQNWRYTPWVWTIKQMIEAGELGSLRAARTLWLQNAVADDAIRPGNWLLDGKRAGGGPVISLTVHNLDCLRYLLGEPTQIYASCVYEDALLVNGAESWAMAQCRFVGGVIVQLLTSYAYSTHTSVMEEDEPLSLYGTEGAVYVRAYPHALELQSRLVDGRQAIPIRDDTGLPTLDPYVNELLHFVDCAQSGREPLTSGEDNIKTIGFVEAIYESARRGQVVSLPEMTMASV